MKDIYIYGEVVPPFLNGPGYCNLKSLKDQLKLANGEDIRVRLNCVGGDVNEGFAMYSEIRRYASENKAKVTTLAEGMCASIATVIFLAGDHRIMNEYTEPFVHNAWVYTEGDSKAVQKMANVLDGVNTMIAKHYEKHTDLSFKDALILMEAETFISVDDCLNYRFAHEIENVVKPINLILKTNKMNKSKTSLLNRIKKALNISNKIVFDAENKEVDFYELEDSAEITVGDKAKIDGKPAGEAAEDSKIVMASGETYVFDGEELIEIIPVSDEDEEEVISEEEVSALVDSLEAAQAKIKNQEKEIETLKGIKAKYEALKQDFSGDKGKNKGKNPKDDPKPGFGNAIDNLKNRKKQ